MRQHSPIAKAYYAVGDIGWEFVSAAALDKRRTNGRCLHFPLHGMWRRQSSDHTGFKAIGEHSEHDAFVRA